MIDRQFKLSDVDKIFGTVPMNKTINTGRYINVWHCGGLSMVLLQLKDPLELYLKRREFLCGSRFLSCRDMAYVESDLKPKTFILSFHSRNDL